jgi:phage gpG-like protein
MVEGGDPKSGPKIESAIVNVDLVGTRGAYTALHDFGGTVSAGGPSERPDREHQSRRKDHGSREVNHLARHRVCTHTPYLASHC